MKKKLLFLFVVMFSLSILSAGIVKLSGGRQQISDDKVTIVTSFYPMYIIALNLTENIDNVEVVNLTDNNVGCLHDYQLTTRDMRTLNDANILILNGGDMELFLENVLTSYPTLDIINASEGITFLEGVEHVHGDESSLDGIEGAYSQDEDLDSHVDEDLHSHADEDHDHSTEVNETTEDAHNLEEDVHDHDGHTHSAINGHVWLDMNRYLVQIDNVAKSLALYDSKNANAYTQNAKTYMEKVSKLRDEFEKAFAGQTGLEIVGFHGAFSYLADELSFEMIHSLDMDSDTVLSAGDIATVIEEVKHHNVKYLFAEDQYSKDIANRIAEETNAQVCILETLVSGEVDKDAYLTGMQKNLDILKNILKSE